MGSRELSEWRAYASIEPFGEERADMRAAMICMVLANVWRGKGEKAYELADFMLKFEAEPEPMTPAQMMQAFQMATGARR